MLLAMHRADGLVMPRRMSKADDDALTTQAQATTNTDRDDRKSGLVHPELADIKFGAEAPPNLKFPSHEPEINNRG